MMNELGRKYELTDETIEIKGHTLHRIKALRKFGYITAGQLGGYVESDENLSHEGNSWIHDKAKVFGCGKVRDDAQIFNRSVVCGNSLVCDDAWVKNDSLIDGVAIVCDNAHVKDSSIVSSNSIICGDAHIMGNSEFFMDAYVDSSDDYLVIAPFGEYHDNITFYRTNTGDVNVCGGDKYNCGLDEFVERLSDDPYNGKQEFSIVRFVRDYFEIDSKEGKRRFWVRREIERVKEEINEKYAKLPKENAVLSFLDKNYKEKKIEILNATEAITNKLRIHGDEVWLSDEHIKIDNAREKMMGRIIGKRHD